ncbi:hypothetical protein [Oryzifoliimicrobium ureilyticus]|uniref:hypothetical protein n=1 Tax=Oryzifoliimicrobium ureilyticus TaxID=3113724 RepID=UPI0030766FC9
MTRGKVHEISPVSATASARRVDVGQTNSILSDPDGRWIAKRQGAINEAFEKRGCSQNSKPVGAKDRVPRNPAG